MLDSDYMYIGTAGWLVPKGGGRGAEAGTHLERYAAYLNAVEINSSFHRHHRPETYRRWADTVPANFRFSVKIPKAITHESGLRGYRPVLDRFLTEAGALGGKLGTLLVQLPPSLEFETRAAGRFFRDLRSRTRAGIACEPRHPTWSTARASELLASHRVTRVAADPPLWVGGDEPAGWEGLRYYRQHGSPRIYYSNYEDEALHLLSSRLDRPARAPIWCIFDNTVLGHAFENALTLKTMLCPRGGALNDV